MQIVVQNVNYKKIHLELISAGLKVLNLSNDAPSNSDIAQIATITFAVGTNMQLVQSIIDAHDPTPLPAPIPYKERLEELEQMVNILLLGGV